MLATMLWHVTAIVERERRHVTYGDAGRTTTVRTQVHFAVMADDSNAAAEMVRAQKNVQAIARVDAVQSGVIRMREGVAR